MLTVGDGGPKTGRTAVTGARPGAGRAAVPPAGSATVVIITHNSAAHVGAALSALRRTGLGVRVVDNASTDATVTLLRRDHPWADLLVNDVNVGFAAAVNQALAEVDTPVVLLVNPDCVLPPETAWELVALLLHRPDIGVAGPGLVDRHGQAVISAHPFESLTSVVASRFGGSLLPVSVRRLLSGRCRRRLHDTCRTTPGEPLLVPADWVSGACLAVRTSLLRVLGGLDEGYFLYYEDEELCLQARRRGARVVYLPHLRAAHVGGGSSPDPTVTWPHLYRSMLRFFARHRSRSLPAVRVVVLVRALLGVLLALVRAPLGVLLALLRPGNTGQPSDATARLRAWSQVYRLALSRTPPLNRSTGGESPRCTS